LSPFKPLTGLEGEKIKIKIVDVEDIDAGKLYLYLGLPREGKDVEDLFGM